MEIKDENAGLDKNVFWYGLASSDFMSLETSITHTSSSKSRKERVSLLSWAMFSFCKPLRKCTGTWVKIKLEAKVWRCFPGALSFCCNTPDAKKISSNQHGAGGHHPRVRDAISSEAMVRSRNDQTVCWRRQLRREDKERV